MQELQPLNKSSPEPAGSEEHGSAASPSSTHTGAHKDLRKLAAPSSKGSKRAAIRRVVTVPIADMEVSRLKGEGAPPPDSWSWRKYGQKPIKSSPYPRGYYRCSSSKGCPAKKQVERSRADPTMLIVTYAAEHNHTSANSPSPSSSSAAAADSVVVSPQTSSPRSPASPKLPTTLSSPSTAEDGDSFGAVAADADLLFPYEFGWFSQIGALPRREAIFHIPVWGGGTAEGHDGTLGEEEEVFAGLGELPECSLVFRKVDSGRRLGLAAEAPLCGSTG